MYNVKVDIKIHDDSERFRNSELFSKSGKSLVTCGYMSECDRFHTQAVITIFFGYTCIKTYQTCHKKSLLPNAMVPVLLKSLRSDVPQGLHAKNTHGNMGVCRHTHIHIHMINMGYCS